MLSKRQLLTGGAAGVLLAGFARAVPARAAGYPLTLTDVQWRAKLTPTQYAVLRQEGTEAPGSSPLLKEHRAGIFSCAGCQLDAYSSKTKFESGTGEQLAFAEHRLSPDIRFWPEPEDRSSSPGSRYVSLYVTRCRATAAGGR